MNIFLAKLRDKFFLINIKNVEYYIYITKKFDAFLHYFSVWQNDFFIFFSLINIPLLTCTLRNPRCWCSQSTAQSSWWFPDGALESLTDQWINQFASRRPDWLLSLYRHILQHKHICMHFSFCFFLSTLLNSTPL